MAKRAATVGGVRYESLAECARALGVQESSVLERFHNGTLADMPKAIEHGKKGQRRVLCLTTGKEWGSARACAIDVGLSKSTISRIAANGDRYVYLNEGRND